MPATLQAIASRTAGFAIVWIVLYGFDPAGLPLGIVTAAVATWWSLRLVPPGTNHPSPIRAVALAGRFVTQSIIAGTDVARRALDPRMPLAVGFVRYHPRLRAGLALNAFCDWASLLPGSLPCEIAADGSVLLHCLDTNQPVAAQMAAEEARFVAAFGCR